MTHHLRIARPVTDLGRAERMYCRGLGFTVLDRFEAHDGFDGVMVGSEGAQFHLEFTHCPDHAVTPMPTAEDLLVFYVALEDEWSRACSAMLASGFERVASFNPYWENRARTFVDADGYRIVLHCGPWRE